MQKDANTTTPMGNTNEGAAVGAPLSTMLRVDDVAELLRCSVRTVYRQADAGRIPRPVKLGALVRWSRQEIERWIATGCPDGRCQRIPK